MIQQNTVMSSNSFGVGGPGGTGTPNGPMGLPGSVFGILVNTGDENAILTNSIFGSASQPGIRLQNNGNNNQTAPVLIRLTLMNGASFVEGSLASVANTDFRIQLFNNNASSDSDQGRTFNNEFQVTTNGAGVVNFSKPVIPLPSDSDFFSATATRLQNPPTDTSEFSNIKQALDQTALILGDGTKENEVRLAILPAAVLQIFSTILVRDE